MTGERNSADRVPRVLHLINGEYFGGSARVLTNYLAAPNRKAQVFVAVFFDGELRRRLVADGIPTELVPMRNRIDLTAVRSVRRLAKRWSIDLVHTHQIRGALLARLASLAGGPMVVSHVHSPALRESSDRMRNLVTAGIERLLAFRTARFIAVSRSLEAELRRHRIAAERIRVVPNGIDLPTLPTPEQRAEVGREFGLLPGEPLIGMVANFRPRKGAEVLIDAVGRLSQQGLPVRLLLVGQPFRDGSNDYAATLRSLAESTGLSGRVIFTGFRSDVERLVGALDVFVLPSLYGEGMPMVLLEAMGAARAVIATPVEGVTEVVRDERDGLLVPTGDAVALAGALRRLLTDLQLRERLGVAARRTVVAGFTTGAMAAGIDGVYAELMSER